MPRKIITNTVLGATVAMSLAIFVACGTITGMSRDANIYGSPAELLFPWSGLLTLLFGGLWIVYVIVSLRRP